MKTPAKQLKQQRERYAKLKNDPGFMEKKRAAARRNRAARDNTRLDRDRNLRKLYGMTLEQFEAMSKAQKEVCAVCATPPRGNGPRSVLHVDHCHDTGRVRGLLCANCNNALGYANDSAEQLRALADYLEN